ncbi:hypothetical protein F6A13_03850 [Acidithiobacillus sp. 'AMD consortium']|jgi:hypothetical protein|uniref:Uncharacterized protein n=2 Tax=Acidithiobacillus ferridurans TaxID=1232575 RepID=A0A8X8GEG1_ACIFI|nr:hypothetical protein [Acidithiobacillus ferridurans]QFG77867.1 hypothetical protein F6A13_03850 [Acidithiobacillus sp. 'AMD consortium']RBL98350.1 hypothetical protein C3R74_14035 [Acidithiobacillus ferridurans]BBF65623.1 hypothetical protein AFERRID_18410 [Acidithiobacillus ferridurans]
MNLESNLRGIKTLAYSSTTWRRNEAAPDSIRRSCGEDSIIRCAGADIGAVQGGSGHCLHILMAQAFS